MYSLGLIYILFDSYFQILSPTNVVIIMSVGITGIQQIVPPFRRIRTPNLIAAVAGVNPVDSGPIALSNVRGQLEITGTSADNGFSWSFEINGGLGNFTSPQLNNWFFVQGTNVNCTVTQTINNVIEIITDAPDNRTYEMVFSPYASVPYTIEKTAGVNLTDNLTVTTTTYRVQAGYKFPF